MEIAATTSAGISAHAHLASLVSTARRTSTTARRIHAWQTRRWNALTASTRSRACAVRIIRDLNAKSTSIDVCRRRARTAARASICQADIDAIASPAGMAPLVRRQRMSARRRRAPTAERVSTFTTRSIASATSDTRETSAIRKLTSARRRRVRTVVRVATKSARSRAIVQAVSSAFSARRTSTSARRRRVRTTARARISSTATCAIALSATAAMIAIRKLTFASRRLASTTALACGPARGSTNAAARASSRVYTVAIRRCPAMRVPV